MDFVCVGALVNTHALKGEVRILSDFEMKDRVFVKGINLYIGNKKEREVINSYRKHKNFDMVTFAGKESINDVINYKGNKVYINRDDLNLTSEEYLESDLIGLTAYYNDNELGTLNEIINNNGYKLMVIDRVFIPYNKNFIEKVDLVNKKIVLKNIEGMI